MRLFSGLITDVVPVRSQPMCLCIIVLLSLFVFFVEGGQANAESAPPIYLSNGSGFYLTRGHIELFKDDSNEITFDQISSPEYSKKFKLIPGDLFGGFSSSTFWLRFTVVPENGPNTWTLELSPYALDRVDVYVSNKFGGFRKKNGGNSDSFYEREVPHRHLSFTFHVDYETPTVVYIRIQSEQQIQLRPVLWNPAVFLQMTKSEKVFRSAFAFASILIILFNAYLWLSSRKSLYGLFTLYTLSLTIYILNDSGFFHQFIFSEDGWISVKITRITGAILVVTGAHLLDRVLSLHEVCPRFSKYIKKTAAIVAIAAVGLTLGSVKYIPGIITCAALNVGVFLSLMTALIVILKKKEAPKTCLLSFVVIFIAFMTRSLTSAGVLPDIRSLENILSLASIIHIILLNVGVSDRIAITRREKDELVRRLEAEQKTVEEQKFFLRRIGHELRTPLSIIDSAAQVMPFMKEEPAQLLEMADAMRTATLRMVTLINNSLASLSVADQNLCTNIKPHNICSIIKATLFCARSTNKGYPLQDFIEDLPTSVSCDALMIETLILNLIDNAIKYSPGKTPVQVRAWCGPSNLYIEVQDAGVGIHSEQQNKIYDKYYRAEQVSGIPGLGLGLYVAKQIVVAHGGSINCSSVFGTGTIFTVNLPLKTVAN